MTNDEIQQSKTRAIELLSAGNPGPAEQLELAELGLRLLVNVLQNLNDVAEAARVYVYNNPRP